MRAKQVVCCVLLLATIGVSGCLKGRTLVGRWETSRSNYHFREDGVVFYRSPSGKKYQGTYRYDDSVTPGILRADLQALDDDQSLLSLELSVTFLSPDSIRFERPRGGRNSSMFATRVYRE